MANINDAETIEIAIELTNDLLELSEVHLTFESLLAKGCIDEKTLFHIKLICDELITNIISYGYDDLDKHTISLGFRIKPLDWSLTIADDGRPFNPLEQSEPDIFMSIDERKIGGLGIHFVNQIVDDIKYVRKHNSNILTMTKKRSS
jgi:serine/threonine-protein kinase RsbW